MKTVEILMNKSIKTDLCCHCGACVGVCPTGAIHINANSVSISIDKCVDCGMCTHICPAEGYALSDLTIGDIKDIPKFSACSVDDNITANASSGGFVTETILSLLEMGEVTAAAVVVTGENLTESSAKYIVTSSREDILSARRSKYTQASIAGVLEYIKNNDGRYAVVGLPCQLYAVSKAMEKIPAIRNRVAYKIGMVCGYTYEESCVDGLLKVLNTKREETTAIIGWREDGLPGKFAVKLHNGDVLSMPFVDEHSVDVTYYAQNRCLLCKDCLCEYGDVVCADIGGWSKRRTLVMTRTVMGHKLVDIVQDRGGVEVQPCDIPFEKTVLPFMLREKRAKVDIRIQRHLRKGFTATSFVGGYSPALLVSQKIEAVKSIKLQEYARKNRDSHSGNKMLKIGHKSYHKISEKFVLKVLFKLQVFASSCVNKCIYLFRKILERLLLALPSVSNKPLRVALIGLGRWGSQYLTLLKKSPKFKVVAAFDNDRRKLEAYSKKYGFKTASCIETLCKDFGADAVFVLTPTSTHASVFEELSKYHIPVYMEKPISANPSETAQIIEAANRESVLLYVAHSMKYEPAIRKIKRILEDGVLGGVSGIKIARTVKSRDDVYYPNAPLYQIGVHLVDVLLYLLDFKEPFKNLCRYTYENIDDVTFTHGCTSVAMRYGFGSVYNFSLQITGSNGYILLADGILTTVIAGKKTTYRIPMRNEKTIKTQLEEFYLAVKKNESFLNTKENAARIISLCDQITKTGDSV